MNQLTTVLMAYTDKYTTRSSSFSDKYSRRNGYLQKEDEDYLLLENGFKIVLSGSPVSDKYSLRNT